MRTYGFIPVEVTDLSKVLYPESKITKGQLINYYEQVAEYMVPQLGRHPVVMHRFEKGIERRGELVTRVDPSMPSWIPRVTAPGPDQFMNLVLCDSTAALIWMVEHYCITPRMWLSLDDRLRRPDRLALTLRPAEGYYDRVRDAARRTRDLLTELGLVPFVMTSGDGGLLILTPLDRGANFETTHAFARDVAHALASRHPDLLSTGEEEEEPDDEDEERPEPREDLVTIEVDANAYAQTIVPPYGVLPLPGAPVAAPLDWHELTGDLEPGRYDFRSVSRRMGQKSDPWSGIDKHARALREPRERLNVVLDTLPTG